MTNLNDKLEKTKFRHECLGTHASASCECLGTRAYEILRMYT